PESGCAARGACARRRDGTRRCRRAASGARAGQSRARRTGHAVPAALLADPIAPMRRRILLPAVAAYALAGYTPATAQNQPPATPSTPEPLPTTIVNPYDVHMETAAFADPNPGDTHAATDWEIWTVAPSQLAWRAAGLTGPERVHAHLGDGTFQGAHAGWT